MSKSFESKYLAWLHGDAPRELIEKELKRLHENIGDSTEFEYFKKFFNKQYKNKELLGMVSENNIINKFDVPDKNAQALKLYFAARMLCLIYPKDYFKSNHGVPPWFKKIFENAASALYEHGNAQFKDLNDALNRIADVVISKGSKNVGILILPQGNVIPSELLKSKLKPHGIRVSMIPAMPPRNDKPKVGQTVKGVLESTIKDKHKGLDLFILIDEVVTGSRFKKIFLALKSVFGSHLLAFALVSPKLGFLNHHHMRIMDGLKKRLEQHQGSIISESDYWIEFSDLPYMKIDSGAPVRYEPPFIWGEEDFVNGSRKVNLTFAMIDQVKYIVKSLKSKQNFRDKLKKIWGEGKQGGLNIIPDHVIVSACEDLESCIDWGQLHEQARSKFEGDYKGDIHSLDENDVKKRMDWLFGSIEKQFTPLVDANRGGFALNLIDGMLGIMSSNEFSGADKNYDYIQYTINYCDGLQGFHKALMFKLMGD